MESEGEASGMEDETTGIEMIDNSSFSTEDESTEDSDYGDDRAFMEKDEEKESNDDIDCLEDKTRESLEDCSYLKDESSKNLEEEINASDEIDEDCEALYVTDGGEASNLRSKNITEQLCGKERDEARAVPREQGTALDEATNNSKKVECKMEAAKEVKKTSVMEVLLEPGRRGWIREVVYSNDIENHIVNIGYISPQNKEGKRRLNSRKNIISYLAQNKQFSDLTMDNFSLNWNFLGLGSGFEVSRKSLQNNARKKEYSQFFTVVVGSSPPTVTCNLCEVEGKVQLYKSFSGHMQRYHLPDETCAKCNQEIPAKFYNKHTKVCDGSETKAHRQAPRNYSQFYTKLEGTSPTQVYCNICNSTVSKRYSNHFETHHLPSQICPVCRKEIRAIHLKKHTQKFHQPAQSCPKCNRNICASSIQKHIRDCGIALACPKCNRNISSSNIKRHVRFCGTEPLECPSCKKVFKNKWNLNEHNTSVHEEKKETCLVCRKEVKHLRIHANFCGKKETCPNCQKEFKYLVLHSKWCGKEDGKETCPKCKRKFKHLRIHSKYCGKQQKETCLKCQKEVKRLRIHSKHCGKKETCPNCQKEFKNLVLHLNWCGKQDGKEICPKCNREFKHLRIHSKLICKPKDKCPKCHKSTSCIKLHMKTCRDRSEKLSWSQLIIEAISKSDYKKLTVSGICSFISENYPSSKINKQAIHNNLSSKKYFLKSPPSEDPNPEDQFSTTQLIVQAISASEEKQLTMSGIHSYILNTYPEYTKSKVTISNALGINRFMKRTQEKSKKDGRKSFLWKIDPRKEEELVGQAFKKQSSGSKNSFWHVNLNQDAVVLDQHKGEELEVETVQENELGLEKKQQDQNENYQVEKEQDQNIDDQVEKEQVKDKDDQMEKEQDQDKNIQVAKNQYQNEDDQVEKEPDHDDIQVEKNKDQDKDKQVQKNKDKDMDDQVEKEQAERINESHEDVEEASDVNDNIKELDGNYKDIDISFSSCSSEIVIVSESE